jgi:hypothetical protein
VIVLRAWSVMGSSALLGLVCPHHFDKTPHRNVRRAPDLTFRGAVLSYRETNSPSNRKLGRHHDDVGFRTIAH